MRNNVKGTNEGESMSEEKTCQYINENGVGCGKPLTKGQRKYCVECAVVVAKEYHNTYEKNRYVKKGNDKIVERGKSLIGDKNPNWKEDKVSYGALHAWVRKHKPKPLVCEICGLPKKLELANISFDGKYHRDINLFLWLCRKCHIKEDGRIDRLVALAKCTALPTEHKKQIQKQCKKRYLSKPENKELEALRRKVRWNPDRYTIGDYV